MFRRLCFFLLFSCLILAGSDVKTNYAAAEHGATVVSSSRELIDVRAIISSKKDKYTSFKCNQLPRNGSLFFVIRLVSEVSVRQLQLSFLEHYSSFITQWRFSLADEAYDPGDSGWTVIAEWEPPAKQGTHTVSVDYSVFGQYLLVEILNYAGSERVCTATRLQVFGVTQLERLEESLEETQAIADDFRQRLQVAPLSLSEPTSDSLAVYVEPMYPAIDMGMSSSRIDGLVERLLRLEMENALLQRRLVRVEKSAQGYYVELLNRASRLDGNLALIQAKYDQLPESMRRLQTTTREDTQSLQDTVGELRRQMHDLYITLGAVLVVALLLAIVLLLRWCSQLFLPSDDLLSTGGIISPPSSIADELSPRRLQPPERLTPEFIRVCSRQPFMSPRPNSDPYSVPLRGDACLALIGDIVVWQPAKPRHTAHLVVAPLAEILWSQAPAPKLLATVLRITEGCGTLVFTLGLCSPARWHVHVLPDECTAHLRTVLAGPGPDRGDIVALESVPERAAEAILGELESFAKNGYFRDPVSVFVVPGRAWVLPHRARVDPLRIALQKT